MTFECKIRKKTVKNTKKSYPSFRLFHLRLIFRQLWRGRVGLQWSKI